MISALTHEPGVYMLEPSAEISTQQRNSKQLLLSKKKKKAHTGTKIDNSATSNGNTDEKNTMSS